MTLRRKHGLAAWIALLAFGRACAQAGEPAAALPPGNWALVFQDEFNGANKDVDASWDFQNGPSGRLLCSRWRENAVVGDGILHLQAKKQQRGGQAWTAASLWTKRTFQYGYFACRYKYAKAAGVNNAFWIMNRDLPATAEGRFEIDINEGHYPSEINMNIHNWSGQHWAKGQPKLIAGADLSASYHVYGLEWKPEELIWYFDGREIRREKNTICFKPAPVWLSLAVTKWAGTVSDAIDGTSMDVDYVRVYQQKAPEPKPAAGK